MEPLPEAQLSSEEQALLRQYAHLSTSSASDLNRLAVEVIPPAVFVALWAYTGKALFLLLLIALLVTFNVWRVMRQRKTRAALQSIAQKLGDAQTGQQP